MAPRTMTESADDSETLAQVGAAATAMLEALQHRPDLQPGERGIALTLAVAGPCTLDALTAAVFGPLAGNPNARARVTDTVHRLRKARLVELDPTRHVWRAAAR